MTIFRGSGGGGNATSDAEVAALVAYQSAAANSAAEAAASADAASTSKANASSSASAAATSASDAAAERATVASIYDQFDDRYLGSKAADPTLDNDGAALLTGALYFNTGTNRLKIYNGTAWDNVAVLVTAFIETLLDDANAAAARTTLAAAASGANADITSIAGNVSFPSTGAIKVPVGTTAERPSPTSGHVRLNTTTSQFEGYTGSAWGSIGGGAKGGGADQIFFEGDATMTTDYTVTTNKNAVVAGPLTINSGVTLTIPSGSVVTIV